MATILEMTSVYLDAQRCGVVTCPKCGVTRTVNLAHYKGELGGKVLKVKCAACATVVNVRFDFRRHHRVAVRLPGTLLQCGTKHILASLTVTSLSVSGVGFTLRTPLLVQPGEHYDVLFFLDDTDHTLIFETIVMRRVADREVGAEFCLEEPYHSTLDFYLMDALLDPEETKPAHSGPPQGGRGNWTLPPRCRARYGAYAQARLPCAHRGSLLHTYHTPLRMCGALYTRSNARSREG